MKVSTTVADHTNDVACPVCGGVAEPTVRIGQLAICSVCGASLIENDEGVQRATFEHVKNIPLADLDALKAAHAAFRRTKPAHA